MSAFGITTSLLNHAARRALLAGLGGLVAATGIALADETCNSPYINMISQSWDGNRVYITSSLLANWDKTGDNNEQFLRGFSWNGSELTQTFEVDFYKEKLGRAHHIKLGSKALKAAFDDQPENVAAGTR